VERGWHVPFCLIWGNDELGHVIRKCSLIKGFRIMEAWDVEG